MIFIKNNKGSPPGVKPVSNVMTFPELSCRKYSPETLWCSKIRPKPPTSVRFLRDVRPMLYGDSCRNISSGFLDSDHAFHRQTVFDAYSQLVACSRKGNRPRTLESLELLRKVRPRLYGDAPIMLSAQLSNLPQPNMGAEPILSSATLWHGRHYSNQGGK